MARVLVLGASGMLGHQVVRASSPHADTYATLRGDGHQADAIGIDRSRIISGVTVQDFDSLVRALGVTRPDVVINCIGIIKQTAAAKDPVQSLTVNSLFPHRLAQLCAASGARLIHISTDCVFSGKQGNYAETDLSDADDLYGRSKLLGEVTDQPHAITLRTSMIGPELGTQYGLVEWFLSNQGKSVRGFTRAIFSGLTTLELSRLIVRLIEQHPTLSGLYHVAAEPVDKNTLLRLINAEMGANITIDAAHDVVIDRSLDGTRFRQATGWIAPAWPEMIHEMAEDMNRHTPIGKATP